MELIKKEEGFTLLEVVISLGIILILVIAFSGGIINSFRVESKVNQKLETIRVTDSIIESLRVNKDDWKSEENWEDIDSNLINDIENIINDENTNYSIGLNDDSNKNIIIERDPEDEIPASNLFLFKIKIIWDDRTYTTEVLLAGDE